MKLPYRHGLFFAIMALLFMATGGLMVWGHFEKWLPSQIDAIALVALMLMVWMVRRAYFIPKQVDYFLKSLLNKNYTMNYPSVKDTRLDNMYEGMNNITQIYKKSLADLEYKQLYYDRLLRIMTHELRNSITPVISLSSDMLKRPENYSSEEMHEGMEVIHDQCVSVKAFLDSYRQLTHLPEPVKKRVEVGKLFEQLKRLMPHSSLHFSWGEGMTVMADADQLTLVLTNLIKNAREATEGLPDAHIQIVASEADGTPYILVADNGPGIPEDMADEIFLPFYTTKSSGSGIGLCLSRQIMRLHGGDLKLNRLHGPGATFMLTL